MAYRRMAGAATSVVELAVGAVKAAIRRGDYAPGHRLVVAELERDLGMSGAALREALSLLAGQGIVELLPHRGAQVRRLDPEGLSETFEIREVLEGLAARLAALRGDAAALEEVARSLALSDAAAAAADLAGFVAANNLFHGAIYAAAGRPRLAAMAEALSLPLDRLAVRRLGRPEVMATAAAEHQVIAAAIRAGDAAAAEAAMRAHVRRSGASMAEPAG
jgi:DNA-binding GntR family transcriptional regulator